MVNKNLYYAGANTANNTDTPELNRNHKDRVFRMLFNNKARLMELYNALNDTNYTNEDDFIINTLDNAIFMSMKNDISFIVGSDMCLYEHQSTICPNMPLRGLFHMSDLYKNFKDETHLYSSTLIKIPVPHYIVFYNGTKDMGDDYSYFISRIRYHIGKLKNRNDKAGKYIAVESAIDDCISQNILSDFLKQNRKEVTNMSIYEYDEEEAKAVFREDGRIEGRAEGLAEGLEQGLAQSKIEDILEVISTMGEIPFQLREKICSETDVDVLKKWFKASLKVQSIDEFEKVLTIK